MTPPIFLILYFAVGTLNLFASRRVVENRRGFKAVGEALFLFALWPLACFVRLVIFAIEGNLWENLE